jgi:hypothetical protein
MTAACLIYNQGANCCLLCCILLLQVVLVQELERWNALVIRMHTVSHTIYTRRAIPTCLVCCVTLPGSAAHNAYTPLQQML